MGEPPFVGLMPLTDRVPGEALQETLGRILRGPDSEHGIVVANVHNRHEVGLRDRSVAGGGP